MLERRPQAMARGLVGIALSVACGRVAKGEGPPGSDTPSQAGMTSQPNASAAGAASVSALEPLLPWQVGNSWTYRITEPGEVTTEKTTTIGPAELVGGVGPNADAVANLIRTVESNAELTTSWQGPSPLNPLRIVRFRERDQDGSPALPFESYYEPEKLRVDETPEHTRAAAIWVEEYVETLLRPGMEALTTAYRELWRVENDDETVTVPAGTFTAVVHFSKEGSTASKHYWYARGVGKVKEEGQQLEELVSYDVEP